MNKHDAFVSFSGDTIGNVLKLVLGQSKPRQNCGFLFARKTHAFTMKNVVEISDEYLNIDKISGIFLAFYCFTQAYR